MTVITLLGGDWEYQFEDERVSGAATNAGTKMLVYNSGPVRTSNAVYSALAEAMDDFQGMGFDNPMLPVTPNQYTMENQAFIARRSLEWLREGTIISDGTIVGTEGFIRKVWSGGTAPVAGDIGREIIEGTSSDTGTLLDFETEPDGTTVLWIRPNDASTDTFALATALTITGGTGNPTGVASPTNGINRDTAIQVIGSVPTATEVYVVQDRIKLNDQAGSFQWWTTDPTVSLGIVSILVRTMRTGTAIADQDVEVFARRYTSQYDNFRLRVNAGGFSALPLSSAPDINNTTGYAQVTTDAWDTLWTPVVGDVFQWQGTPSQKGVITAVSGTGPNFTIEFYHTGDLGAFNDNDIIEDVAQTGDLTLSSNETVVSGGPTDASANEGGTVTITLGHTTRDHDNSGTAEPYSVIVDAQSNVPIAKVYERIKYVTRRGATAADLFGAGVNVPGETYRGMEATVYYDNLLSGPWGEGEDILHDGGTWTARSMSHNSGAAGEGVSQAYFTYTDGQTSIDAIVDGNTIDDESGSSVDVDTAGAGGAIVTHSPVKLSPLGSFTGTQIFGAPGIDFRNPASADTQAYILTDDLGTLRSPPNTISFTVTNTRAGDRVLVARDTGTAGIINKDQFGGMTAVAASSKTITVGGSIDVQVPTSGYIRVVENTLLEEHKYYYSSRTTGASGVFTLTDITASTANDTGATTTPTLLNDSTASFQTEGVVPGMLIQDTTNSDTYEVVSLVSGFEETRINIRQVFGTGGTLASGDAYTINETIQLYATSDDIFDLIIDAEEDVGTDGTPGTIQNTLVKTPAADFDVVVQVRLGKTILPFEQNQTVSDTNVSVTAVRTPDTVAV